MAGVCGGMIFKEYYYFYSIFDLNAYALTCLTSNTRHRLHLDGQRR